MKLCITEKVIEQLGEYGGRMLGRVIGEELLDRLNPEESMSIIELNKRLASIAEELGFEEVSLGMEDSKGRLRIICGDSCTSLLFMVRGIAEKILYGLFNLSPEGERVVREEVIFLFGKEGGIEERVRRKLEFLEKLWSISVSRRGVEKSFPGEHLLNPSFSPESSLSEYKKILGI